MNEPSRQSAIAEFMAEMRRRHVVRFALGYAAAAFVVLQLAEIIFPAFGLGESALRVLVIVVALGFPPATVLAWIFDLTADGIHRTEGHGADTVVPRLALLVVTVGVMSGLGVWLGTRGAFTTDTPEGAATERRRDSARPAMLAEYDPSVPIRSIAVLPLDDFSEEGGQAYFTAGMHEELIAKLSQIDGLRVVSRTSVAQYAGTTKSAPVIGRELGVDALIEGSVQRAGNQVRITLQIIHAASDSHIETIQFNREVTNILQLQSEVAHEVAFAVAGEHEETERLSQTAMNAEPEAQDAYLRGKFEYDRGTPEGYQAAMDFFTDAVSADPDFAPALAGLAGTRFMIDLEDGELDADQVERAREEAGAALDMDSSSTEAIEVYSFIQRAIPRVMSAETPATISNVESPNVRVITVPGVSDSIVLDLSVFDTAWVSATTSIGQRLEEQARSSALSGGRDAIAQQSLAARQLMLSGRFGEAASVLGVVVGDSPEADPAWEALTRAQISAGWVDDAVESVRAWSRSGAAGAPNGAAVAALEHGVATEGMRGYWAWTLDRLTARRDAGQRVSHTSLAAAHAGLGDSDAAIAELALALENEERDLLGLRSDPVWDDLRRDERFMQISREARTLRYSPAFRRPGEGRGGRGDGRGPNR